LTLPIDIALALIEVLGVDIKLHTAVLPPLSSLVQGTAWTTKREGGGQAQGGKYASKGLVFLFTENK